MTSQIRLEASIEKQFLRNSRGIGHQLGLQFMRFFLAGAVIFPLSIEVVTSSAGETWELIQIVIATFKTAVPGEEAELVPSVDILPITMMVILIALAAFIIKSLHSSLSSFLRAHKWGGNSDGRQWINLHYFWLTFAVGIAVSSLASSFSSLGTLTLTGLWFVAFGVCGYVLPLLYRQITAQQAIAIARIRTIWPRGGPMLSVMLKMCFAIMIGACRVVLWAYDGCALLLCRLLRYFHEGSGYSCSNQDCSLSSIEDPCLRCCSDGCDGSHIQTYPKFSSPLFVMCPSCETIHPTWVPAAVLIRSEAALLSERRCKNTDCDQGASGPSSLAVMNFNPSRLAQTLESVAQTFGGTPQKNEEPRSHWIRALENGHTYQFLSQLYDENGLRTILMRRGQKQLSVSVLYVLDPAIWGGAYEGIVWLLPNYVESQDDLHTYLYRCLQSCVLPHDQAGWGQYSPHPPAGFFRRVFLKPRNPKDVESQRMHMPKLALWTSRSFPKTVNCFDLNFQILSSPADVQSFVEEVTA